MVSARGNELDTTACGPWSHVDDARPAGARASRRDPGVRTAAAA